MSDFKDRLLTEQKELNEKISKLRSFTGGSNFKSIDEKQQELLKKQLIVMDDYQEILIERINLLV